MDIDHIKTKQDFIEFLGTLRTDFVENSNAWENSTIESYLEAMQAYVSDSNIQSADWKTMAEILVASSVYE